MRTCREASIRRITATLLAGLVLLAARSGLAAEGDSQIKKGAAIALVVSSTDLPDPGILAVDDLSSYLQRTLEATVSRYPAGTKLADLSEDACFVIGAASDPGYSKLVQQAKANIATDDLGDEGGRIKSASVGDTPVVFLVGKTWTGACHAVYSFLETEVGVGFFIDGDHVPKLSSLSLAGFDRAEIPRVPIRGLFYHPTWPHPYANCCRLWSFDKWKQFLDWMRHRRVNVLPLFHDEGGYSWGDVIFKAFPKIEKNDKTLSKFITDPTWRTELNKEIFDYARKSGVKIAFNLFYSQVPELFTEAYPDLDTHPLRMRNVGIDMRQPECKRIMKQYWQTLLDTYGIDDSHLYFICSYSHELPLPDYLESRNPPTLDAIEVLREIDPKAKIFVETWCWKYLHEDTTGKPRYQWLNENAPIEWHRFNAEMPPDIGVADWDTKKDLERIPDPRFAERPYVQLTHTTMEGWWPPDTLLRSPQWLINYFDRAITDGAEGIMSFHIHAGTNPLLADLTAEIGLEKTELPAYYRSYARRRFGAQTGDTMAESIQAFCNSLDMGPNGHISTVRGGYEDMALFLTFPGFRASAEEMLQRSEELDKGKRQAWIKACLDGLKPKAELAGRALLLARSASSELEGDSFYKEYMWQLDYVSARMEGVQSLFRAYLVADKDPAEAERLYERAITAFTAVEALFLELPQYQMSKLRELEPDVPYTKAFLKDWEFRGSLDSNTYGFHVVYERMPIYEEFMQSLRPPQLGPAKRSALDVRPFFEVLKDVPTD